MLGVIILAGVPSDKKVQLGQADEWLYVQYIIQSYIRPFYELALYKLEDCTYDPWLRRDFVFVLFDNCGI